MLKIINSGCNGNMGRVVASIAAADPDVSVVAGFDIAANELPENNPTDYPVYADPSEFAGVADVIIDFSNPAALDGLLNYGLSKNIPLILCTTGYAPDQITAIQKAAEQIPLLLSGNMSLGINLLVDLIKRACAVLGDGFDVEITERHHRRKIDAPSGTALLLADAAASALPYDCEYVFERESRRQPRSAREIGISSVRGGTIIGVHDVIFAGLDEMIELRHTASSRDIFAVGAIRAAKFIAGKVPRMYTMKDVLG